MTENLTQNLLDWRTAASENPLEATYRLVGLLLRDNIQAARLLSTRTFEKEDTERLNKYRDLRTFRKLEGEEVPPLAGMRLGRIGNREEREFKRTSDLGRVIELSPKLIGKAIEESEGDPYKLKAKLRGLKQTSYQTMPSPEDFPISFLNYIQFLEKSQGKQEASDRLVDYIQQRNLNKVKGALIP